MIFSCSSWVDANTNLYVELGPSQLQASSKAYRLPCPVVSEPGGDHGEPMKVVLSNRLRIYLWLPSGQMAPQPRLTQELQGMPRSQRSFNLNEKMVRMWDRGEKSNQGDLRHSAHESRVPPRPRFLATPGAGDESRSLLGDEDGMMMGRRVTKDRKREGGGYKCA